MHVVVIGAGVIGVTTAYYLTELGCRVTVVGRETEVGDGASFGNAGQLSYSFTDALARPEFVAKIPSLIAGRDLAYRVRIEPALIPWGVRFLTQCTRRRARENTLAVLSAALRSQGLMEQLLEKLPFEFAYRTVGKLVLLSDSAEVRHASANAALKNEHGCNTEIIDPATAIDIEPALADMAEDFVGAVYSKTDCVADSHAFTVGLKDMLEASGRVTFNLGTQVKGLHKHGRRLRAIELEDGELEADAAVVCTGAWSGELLRPLGVHPHIYPVRGYSVTLPPGESAPRVSVTILNRKIVFSRINGDVRLAGFADFKGFSTSDDHKRIAALIEAGRSYAPAAADYSASDPHEWGGFRPMTPDGRPHVGPSGIDGLYLNTGHGMLGWTLACASGHDVAHQIADAVH